MKLEGFIADLLHKHNCVIVPDFGGFVSNYRSATIDSLRKKIHPPSKSVLFNPLLTNNDGLLANYVSQKEEVTYSDALDMIYLGVDVWNKRFGEGERIEIGELGFMYKENGKVQFEQSREVNLLLQAYGLRSIDFVNFKEQKVERKVAKPVEEEKIEIAPEAKERVQKAVAKVIPIKEKVEEKVEVKEETSTVVEEKKEEQKEAVIAFDQKEEIIQLKQEDSSEDDEPIKKRRIGMTILKYTAAAAIVPILFYSYWIPMETDALETKSIQLSDFNPINEQAEKTYKLRDSEFVGETIERPKSLEEITSEIDASIYNLEVAEDFYVSIQLDKTDVDTETEIVEAEMDEAPVVQEVVSGEYFVISGCFGVKNNATNKVSDLQSSGFNASILDRSGGLHRVTAGGYSSREDAEAGLQKLQNAGHSGWILKK